MVWLITAPASDAGRPPCPPGADLGNNRVSPAASSIHNQVPKKRFVSHPTRKLGWHSVVFCLNLEVGEVEPSCQAVSHPSKHVNQPSTAARRFKWLHLPDPHYPSLGHRRISDESRLPSKAKLLQIIQQTRRR